MRAREALRDYAVPLLWGMGLIVAVGAAALVAGPAALFSWLGRPWSDDPHHHVAGWVAWHARLMVGGWAVLIPVGILAARYFKVTPRQRWPDELDNKSWWHAHRVAQTLGMAVAAAGLAIVVRVEGVTMRAGPHAWLGWLVMASGLAQLASGIARGTKGAPATVTHGSCVPGDHYDMTLRRVAFEYLHKYLGLVAALAAIIVVVLGLGLVDAPRWMWLVLGWWWGLLAILTVVWQRQGRCLDTYHAIWGPDPLLPGNARRPIGLGVTRRPPGRR